MVQGEDALKIGVIGLGYIGSVTAAVLAAQGNQVIGIDNVESKVQSFKTGNIPIYEPGLNDIVGVVQYSEISIAVNNFQV